MAASAASSAAATQQRLFPPAEQDRTQDFGRAGAFASSHVVFRNGSAAALRVCLHTAAMRAKSTRTVASGRGRPVMAKNSVVADAAVGEPEPPAQRGAAENVAVQAVLFDMDGVLCDSEDPSREAAVALFKEMGYSVNAADFVPFMGTGEANFLGGVARVYNVPDFDTDKAKARFFEIYIGTYATPNSGIGFPGALELVQQCKAAGLKVAVASSADRVKVDANLAAAGIPITNFDAVVSADKFERLKPAPDIFLAAAKELGLEPQQCIVIEDALAGVQAAQAAGMRCIAVTTTLDADALSAGSPALIRKDISHISLDDVTSLKYPGSGGAGGGSGSGDESEEAASGVPSSNAEPATSALSLLDSPVRLPWGMTTSRRDILRLSSLTVGLGTLAYMADNLKAFSYASPKAVMNLLMGPAVPVANAASGDKRLAGLTKYIDQLESSGGGDKVPDFAPQLAWLNSPPLSLSRELRGKLVLLDFWTYCCINCMHVLPDLAYLEKKYKDSPFVVVGVHSAKFDNEKDADAIRNAVLRYDVAHPVVNDGEMTMWRALGVSSWPTLALVSPEGKLIGMLAGEGNKQVFDDLIAASLDYYGAKGLLDTTPVPVSLEKSKDQRLLSTPLRFPGKIATDLYNNRLFVSDSNNRRIVVTTLSGEFITQVGGAGGEGLKDGSFDTALFNRPQGVAYHPGRDVLYVADTENHALREVDFAREQVRTLAGNGTKGRDYEGGGKGPDQVLNSPWDVALDADATAVYIAMAGQHQIWRHDIDSGVTKVFSGTGYERNQNGRTATDTAYAQPSGLSLSVDGKEMFCADSESSAVRAINLRTGGSRLCAGGDAFFAENLFKFGDRDGPVSRVLLQHPLGVLTLDDKRVIVADSYNHKIKVFDASTNTVDTIVGTGTAGFADGSGSSAQLSEPAGLAAGPQGTVYVADTNNSVIRVLDLSASPVAVSTLDLSTVPPPPPPQASGPRRLRRRQPPEAAVIDAGMVTASSGEVQVQVRIPQGYHFTKGVESKFDVAVDGTSVQLTPSEGSLNLEDLEATVALQFEASGLEDVSKAQVNCKVYYCQEDDVCLYQAITFKLVFSPDPESNPATSKRVPLQYQVVPKKTQVPVFAVKG